jgi:hypothetical protein
MWGYDATAQYQRDVNKAKALQQRPSQAEFHLIFRALADLGADRMILQSNSPTSASSQLSF